MKPQSEDSEYERIILSNLYRGIQERRRVLHPAISETYKNEYAHILNSDCDLTEKSRNSTREQKEILADEQAYKMMKNILYTQYRCEQSDILVEIKRIYTNVISDQKIFGIAAKWSKDSLRNFENFQ